nr:MAG TPA: hypothetical protein [Caudoviricetes sp.]
MFLSEFTGLSRAVFRALSDPLPGPLLLILATRL